MINNSERLVVVTGGTKGIGKSIVHRFAAEGFRVATCARNESDLTVLKEEISKTHDQLIHTYAVDLSKREGQKDFIDFIGMIGQPVEILINNTGTFIPGLVHEEDEGTLEKMMDTNLYSAYHVSRGIIPQMKQDRRGHIFNLCSVASLKAYPNGGSYSISKFALYGFSQALREELREFEIRVTSILAGAVKTPSWDGVEIPDERFMKPEDIAETIYATYKLSERTVVEDIVLRPQLGDL
ncbi:MAG: SDR family oxidoreductase [Bacteroidota bacterium]